MKNILLILILLMLSKSPTSNINGKWKLLKVETSDKIFYPKKKDYFLSITEKTISYNLEVNNCWTEKFEISSEDIFIDYPACTKICCDGRSDTISNFLNYHGKYILNEPLLIIENTKAKLYLTRQQ